MISKPRICNNCGCMEWNVTAHVTQGWKVNAFGDFLEETDSCEVVTHAPSEDDLWYCAQCGAEYSVETAPRADKDPAICFLLYERYQMDWILSQGHTIAEIMQIIQEWAEDDELVQMYTPYGYFEEVGFGGSIYVCYEEFMMAEYLDPYYIRSICPEQDKWLEYVKDLNTRL